MAATIGRWRYENASRAISLRSWTDSTSARRRAAANAATSKYAHHKAQATAMPRIAATMTPPSTPASAPTPIATIDSPRATITMRPWRSAKWPATSRQPLVSMNSGPAMSNTSAAAHTATGLAVEERAGHQDRHADRGAHREADDGVAEPRVVAAGEDEQRDVRGPHAAVGDGQGQAEVTERVGHAQRRDEQRGHRGEHHQTHPALVGVDHAGQPRVADPRPPQQAEHDEAPTDASPRRVVRPSARCTA